MICLKLDFEDIKVAGTEKPFQVKVGQECPTYMWRETNGLARTSLIQNPSDRDNLFMNTSIQGSSDSQPSFLWPRRLAIVACLIVGSVFSFRAMMPDVAAKVTSETSQRAQLQGSVELTVPADADVKLVTKNIEDIQAGDLVLARDEHGSAIGFKPVKETYQRVSHHLRHLTFETPDGTQQTLSTTDEHPFWSVTAEEFVEAGSLIVGHSVTGPNGETQTLISSNREEFPNGIPVFNFQVTDYHTYFVGASADKPVMLVHNADCLPLKIGDFTQAQRDTLKGVWDGTTPRAALPLSVKERLAELYSDIAKKNPPGSAQSLFNQARADFLLGYGPNPGRSVTEFAERMGLDVFRR